MTADNPLRTNLGSLFLVVAEIATINDAADELEIKFDEGALVDYGQFTLLALDKDKAESILALISDQTGSKVFAIEMEGYTPFTIDAALSSLRAS